MLAIKSLSIDSHHNHHHHLLPDQNTAVSHLAITQGLHSRFDTILGQGEGHGSRGNLLIGSELNQSAQTVARCNKRTLDTDTLEVHEEKGNR